jgi:ATP-dependent protease ClpP protease subunit
MDKKTKKILSESGSDIIKVIQLHGEVSDEITLSDLQKQAGDISKFDTLVLEIASPGGSVSEGLNIMVWLDSLSAEGKRIVTVVTANSYSIASLIMLVADIKLISNSAKVMVHNPMVPLLEYVNANDLQQYIDNLRALENTMYELYEFFTGLNKEQIKKLMDNETYLSPQEAVEYGFADMIVDIKPKSYEMTANNKNEINMSKTLNILNKVIGMVNKSEFINQIYSDLEGQEIEIFQMDPSTYSVGDRTSMEEGQVVLSDGSKLTISEGKISEIDRSAEGVEEAAPEAGDFNEGEAPKMEEEEIVSEKEEMMDEEPKMEMEPKMEAPIEEMIEVEAKEEVAIEAKEIEVEAKEIEVEAKEIEAEAKEEVMEEEVIEAKEEIMEEEVKMDGHSEEEMMDEPKMEEEVEEMKEDEYMVALEARIEALEAKLGEYENKFEALNKFENIATEAIDTLANNTVSTFKPEARVTSTPSASKGSIFSQLKTKRGL